MAASSKKSFDRKKTVGEKATPAAAVVVKAPVEQKPQVGFPVVGIGASAGGLEALQTFFKHVPVDLKATFMVIQHLSPHHKSAMAQLLAGSANMPLVELKRKTKIKPGCIFLNPPDRFVSIEKGNFILTQPHVADSGMSLPIDYFFNALARAQMEKSICIILSGSASDGTQGLKAIKAAGGLTFAQSPESAKYTGMPDSAIATQMVDFILPVEQIPSKLAEMLQHPYLRRPEPISADETDLDKNLKAVFSLIRKDTGHDFSQYKINTIRRRIARRMAVHQVQQLADYITVLARDPSEPGHLLKDMLIGVTGFFRDGKAFEVLEEKVVASLLDTKKAGESIRVWVPGCASGEEVYSIAILFSEAMEQRRNHVPLQIFASDIDAEAIQTARTGSYPDNVLANVPRLRLTRFFARSENQFKIKKSIRDRVVFSIHNLIADPPFSRMDLISCRNLLIYLKQDLQKKVITLFHYALNSGGYLFLGPSETIGDFSHLFETVSMKHKLFRHQGIAQEVRLPISATQSALDRLDDSMANIDKARSSPVFDPYSAAEKYVLEEYAPPGVVLGRNLEIVHFIGQTDRFLRTPRGRASLNILKMARDGMLVKLTQILNRAQKTGEAQKAENLTIKVHNELVPLDVSVRPLPDSAFKDLLLVLFHEHNRTVHKAEAKAAAAEKGTKQDPTVRHLKEELLSTKEFLQSAIEELEVSNEEYKATNEELQSVNEELQSANEELETSREELQSTNEELMTVNSEHQQKIDELTKSNNDINNLLESTEIASLFLDLNLCVRRFTPALACIVNLRRSDIGRPITDITTRLIDVDIFVHTKLVIETLDRKKIDVQDDAGKWYEMSILPYRTNENVIDGVTIAFIDVTGIRLASHLQKIAAVFENAVDAVTVQDYDGNILAWNPRAQALYGWREEEARRMHVNEIMPEVRRLDYAAMTRRLQRGEYITPFKMKRLNNKGEELEIWFYALALEDEKGGSRQFATFERPIKK